MTRRGKKVTTDRDGSGATRLQLHALAPLSLANGPGRRAVIWFQGCDRHCDGCCNPETRAAADGFSKSVEELLAWLETLAGDIDGVTISGGEPMLQAPGLLALLRGIRRRTTLSVVLFSGYTREEIERHGDGPAILARVDLLIDGPFDPHAPRGTGLAASANQQHHFFSGRITPEQMNDLPSAELIVDETGWIRVTGVDSPRLMAPLQKAGVVLK